MLLPLAAFFPLTYFALRNAALLRHALLGLTGTDFHKRSMRAVYGF